MVKAQVNGKTIAVSRRTVTIDGIQYFPPEAVHKQILQSTQEQESVPGKGEVQYYNIVVDGSVINKGVWAVEEPSDKLSSMKGYFAFSDQIDIVSE